MFAYAEFKEIPRSQLRPDSIEHEENCVATYNWNMVNAIYFKGTLFAYPNLEIEGAVNVDGKEYILSRYAK